MSVRIPHNKLSVSARALLAVSGLLIILSHGYVASVSYSIHLGNFKAAGFLLTTLAARKELAMSLVGQMLVIVLFHLVALIIVALLARQRSAPRHWIQRDVVLVPSIFVATSWLVLRVHSLEFPNSIWTWLLQPVFARSASYALDGVFCVLLVWRILDFSLRTYPWSMHRGRWISKRRILMPLAGIVAVLMVAELTTRIGTAGRGGMDSVEDRGQHKRRPNVVILGLDSVQRDVLLAASSDRMPNLAALREKSFVNGNVVSPVARTFPAWVTILTGMHPKDSAARENHAPQASVKSEASIAWAFAEQGYKTVYATDETRFSHIGREFGFETVIGPQKGVTDFIFGQFADFPLVNFFVQLPYSEWLLPALAGNRAFAQAYYPDRFVDLLGRSLPAKGDAPTFAAVHLCTAHWPFFVGDGMQRPPSVQGQSDAYIRMLLLLDRQLGKTLRELRGKGYLDDNTILVVLSDHGEDFIGHTRPQTQFHGVDLNDLVLPGGHGNTLLSRKQWQVFVMVSGSNGAIQIEPGLSMDLTSLEDVAPLLLRLTGVSGTLSNLDQVGNEPAKMETRTHVLMETGWRPTGLDLSSPDRKEALRIAESSYNVMSDGRVEMKDDAYAEAIAYKDIGVTNGSESLVTMGIRNIAMLVSADHDENTQHVYNLDQPQAVPRGLPLMEAACQELEMQRRIPGLCSDQ